MTRWTPIVAAAVGLSAAATGCGVELPDEQAAPSTTEAPTTVETSTTTDRTGPASTTTEATAPDSTVAGPPAGTTFDDPQGSYRLTVADDWVAKDSSLGAETEVWFVGGATDGFAPNVNVLTQPISGVDLGEYLDRTVEAGSTAIEDFALVDRRVVTTPDGDRLGVLEYSGRVSGHDLSFLQVAMPGPDDVVLATFTAPAAAYAAHADEVERSLLTLQRP